MSEFEKRFPEVKQLYNEEDVRQQALYHQRALQCEGWLEAKKDTQESISELCRIYDVKEYHGLRNILRQLELRTKQEIKELENE